MTTFSDEYNKKVKFILSYDEFFINMASLYYPFNKNQLRKYKSILDWKTICGNSEIEWTLDLIIEFEELLTDKEENKFDWQFQTNEGVEWSYDLIKYFHSKWEWEYLAQNSSFMSNKECCNLFQNELLQYFETIEKLIDTSNYFTDGAYAVLHNANRNVKEMLEHKEFQIQTIQEIDKTEKIDFKYLSQNEILPWSEELLDKYSEKWFWNCISSNQSIPWNLPLLKKYESKLLWFKRTEYWLDCVSANLNIKWDSELLKEFHKKIAPVNVSVSHHTCWTIDLLWEFSQFWEYATLSHNVVIWEKVFNEFNSEKSINEIFDLYLKMRD